MIIAGSSPGGHVSHDPERRIMMHLGGLRPVHLDHYARHDHYFRQLALAPGSAAVPMEGRGIIEAQT